MLVRWPVPIVATRGGIIPLGVFALLFVAFSGHPSPSMLAACALLGGIGGVVSLIVHELGHISVARRLSGVRPEKVSVMSLGAAAHFEGSYRSGREQARMALGGPEASFAFALALSLPVFFPAPAWLKVGALALVLLNVAIGGLSLLPVHPLDGHKLIVGLVRVRIGGIGAAARQTGRNVPARRRPLGGRAAPGGEAAARRGRCRNGRGRLRPEASAAPADPRLSAIGSTANPSNEGRSASSLDERPTSSSGST